MGGLGNQMFQISKALSEGLENSIDVKFKLESSIPMEGNQPSKYKNNIFRNIKFEDFNDQTLQINEPNWSYSNLNVFYYTPVKYYGYFQSSKNFKNQAQKIKDIFSPTQEFIEKLKNLHPKIFDEDSVSIHVRRGDYLSITEILPVIDKSYIDECLKQIEITSNIFVFSNDKEWCKEKLKYDNVTVVEDLDDYEELWAISLCNHNIMSNSSFSWWGSYLNKNKNKKVFVPSLWFGPRGEKNFNDIYEDEWIRINVDYNNGFIGCE
jgi:rRNA-processing protein FCF1